ncbi:hypothetical protein A33M_2440 [Rhodovulum sp. PH10]|uniref:hypothetical protein n=1 Tax=Rhodovulum sp. PH10 TaxID=1187851 RepID=UPI00027C2C1F|nr:hypothetical protein [Rhodovulum sp. PH10]EJW12060.1 hypothetical protein A33M_2440 [Rhodovulum sp. PH10]
MWDVDTIAALFPDFMRDLPITTALVAPDGTIVQVDVAWRAFAAENGLPDPDAELGKNYFSVCPPDLRRKLGEVVDGARPDLSLVYACHAPKEARWMALVAVPLALKAPSPFLTMHFDMTRLLPPTAVKATGTAERLPPMPRETAETIARMLEQTTLYAVSLARIRLVDAASATWDDR